MNGIGMALLLIVLVTVAMSVWIFLPRSHRISGSTDLDKMGEALAGARDAQERLADDEGGLADLSRPVVRPVDPASPPRLRTTGETSDSVPWRQRGHDDQERT